MIRCASRSGSGAGPAQFRANIDRGTPVERTLRACRPCACRTPMPSAHLSQAAVGRPVSADWSGHVRFDACWADWIRLPSSEKNKSVAIFRKSCLIVYIPRSSRGTLRDRHGTLGTGGGGCRMPQRGETRADERQLADVKSCGPGAPMLALSRQVMILLMTVANKPAHRGEHEASVKTIARGMPGCLGCTCGDCRLLFFCRRAMGRGQRPGIPRALCLEARAKPLT
jgi:hypothetical protein